MTQGSTNVPSSSPGQVDFLAGQVTFKAYDVSAYPMGKVQGSHPPTKEFESCLPKGKSGIRVSFFFQALMT